MKKLLALIGSLALLVQAMPVQAADELSLSPLLTKRSGKGRRGTSRFRTPLPIN